MNRPQAMQSLLRAASWDADAVHDDLPPMPPLCSVVPRLAAGKVTTGDAEGVLVAALEPGHAAAEFEQVEVLGGGVPREGIATRLR